MLGVLLSAAAALASTMTAEELATWVTGVERDRGCAVALAVPASAAGDARQAVEAVARVVPVRDEEWASWQPSEAATQGRCVVRAEERTPGTWDAEFVGLPAVTEDSRPHVDIGRTALGLVGGAGAGLVGWLVGGVLGGIADPACVNPTDQLCTINLGEAIGSGLFTGLAAGTTEWAIGGIGRVHSSLPWTLASSAIGVAGGTAVNAISSDPAKESVGLFLQLAGAPIGAAVGVDATSRYDDRPATTATPDTGSSSR